MQTKLVAAELATAVGVNTVILKSDCLDDIARVMAGEPLGTVFRAQPKPLGDRKWYGCRTDKCAGPDVHRR